MQMMHGLWNIDGKFIRKTTTTNDVLIKINEDQFYNLFNVKEC